MALSLNGHDASVCVYIYVFITYTIYPFSQPGYIVTKSQPMDSVKKPIFKRLNIYWIKKCEN